MEESIWERCPSSTNAVERRNRDCDTPQCLKLAMMKMYKVDKVTCLKHIAAEDGIVLSYRSKSEEARRMTAKKRQQYRMRAIPDKESEYGPPDRADNFMAGRKRKSNDATSPVDNNVLQYHPNNHPEIVGKKARMRFNDEGGEEKWYEGMYLHLI